MTKQQFIQQWVIGFLSAEASKEYNDCASVGDYSRVEENAPYEDAYHLARVQWDRIQKMQNDGTLEKVFGE